MLLLQDRESRQGPANAPIERRRNPPNAASSYPQFLFLFVGVLKQTVGGISNHGVNRILGTTPQPLKGIGLMDLKEPIQRWLWKKVKVTACAGCSHVRVAAFYHPNRDALRKTRGITFIAGWPSIRAKATQEREPYHRAVRFDSGCFSCEPKQSNVKTRSSN